MDLVFPHHENEEAQSCAFHHGSQWVSYWLHTGKPIIKVFVCVLRREEKARFIRRLNWLSPFF
jgi:hypothetical protein